MESFAVQQKQLLDFPSKFKSIILSTRSDETNALLSYAPMVYHHQQWIILISSMAPHTRHLVEYGSGSALLIEDESASASIFFRKRLSFNFKATPLNTTKENIDLLTLAHGEMVPMLMKMDFQLWQLIPQEGTFVCGPGQAYTVDGALTITKQNGRPGGHTK